MKDKDGLTPKQRKFVNAMIAGKSPTDSAVAAGYKRTGAKMAAHRMLQNVTVVTLCRAKVEEVTKEVVRKAGVDRAWVVQRLVENVDRAMQAEPVLDKEGNETGEYRYEGSVANRALELIGKECGMFVDRVRVEDIDKLSEAELEMLARGEAPATLKLLA